MEWNPETLQFLSKSFLDTLSPQPEPRRRAEKDLSDAADTPNYGLAVLRLVAEPSVDEQIRQCAALNFKNHLKTRWVPSSATPIPDGEKEQIKTLIVPLMLSATPKIQAQLSEVLAVIGNHEELFAGDEILQQIVIPNVMLRDEDEELFKMNYVEFIRRDMEEGGELDTRRRIACELLKGISGKNKEKISAQIHHCLSLFAENPDANWKYKDCAIYLVVSLATKVGASISTDLVNVESFFRSVIVPELQCEDVNSSFPMLKASALKFFTMFCVLIPKHVVVPLLGDVVRFLGSDVSVVHSYAAICIEKLLLVKDDNHNHNNGVQLQARYTSMDIDPILGYLINNLLDALKKPESEENEYIMRCIMRVLQTADISREVASFCITWLIRVLKRVCKNSPKTHPVFNYFLFEAVATLVRRACEKNPCLVPTFETCLFPIIKMILAEQLTELFPYAFQLLAELVDIYTPPFPAAYMLMFDLLLLPPDLWEKSVNVPGLVRLLQSFLQQAPNEVNREGRLRHVVLGIVNELVSSPTTEEEGFHILNMVIQKYGYDVIAEYMNHTWASLFNRLQNSKTPTLVRCLIIFMSLFLVKHGVQTLVDLVEVNLFHVILGEVWIPNLKTITGCTEVKLSAVASIKLLCESPLLLDPATEELWGKLLDAIVTLLTLPQEERVQNAGGKKEEDWDPLKEIEDPKHFLVAFPANISSEFGGRFPLVIMRYLSPPNQAALVNLCNSYNIAIV